MKLTKSKMNEQAQVRLGSRIGLVVGVVLAAVWLVALGLMLVGMGAWGWVVWPAVVFTWLRWVASGKAQEKKQIAEVDAKYESVVK